MKTLFLSALLLFGFGTAQAAQLSKGKLSVLKVWVTIAGKETSLNNAKAYKNRLSSILGIVSKKSKLSRGKKMLAVHALVRDLEASAVQQFKYLPDSLGYDDVHASLQSLSDSNKAADFEKVEQKAKDMIAEIERAECDIQEGLL